MSAGGRPTGGRTGALRAGNVIRPCTRPPRAVNRSRACGYSPHASPLIHLRTHPGRLRRDWNLRRGAITAVATNDVHGSEEHGLTKAPRTPSDVPEPDIPGPDAADRDEAEDRRLLEAVAQGDRAAFERLFRRYHRRVQGFVRRMIDRPDVVDEVVNDTLYAVWGSAGAFAGRSSAKTWILGIAYRQALKALRGRKRHERLSDGDAPLETVREDFAARDPEAQALADDAVTGVERALATLGSDHRAVVELTALGHSGQEIADIVGCPVGTVKTRMFHARRKIQALLGDEASVRDTADA